MPGLMNTVTKGIRVLMPPVEEQCAIADYSDRKNAKIDQMVVKGEVVNERLQEDRTALITTAVTGRIDVRGATE